MVPVRALFMVLLLVATLTAGCLGGDGDDVETPDDDGTATPTQDTGSVTGTVLTVEVEPIANAQLTLVDSTGELVKTATTGEQGKYVMNGILPGTYRLQVSAICCHGKAETVHVVANQAADVPFMLEPFSDLDLQIPYSESDEYVRFIACMFTLPEPSPTPPTGCGPVGQNNPDHGVSTAPGLRTFIAAMTWSGGEDLRFTVGNGGLSYIYAQATDSSPIEHRIDHDQIEDEERAFEQFDEDGLQLRLNAAPAPGTVVYEKQIYYYWASYYWEKAPAGISVVPDG